MKPATITPLLSIALFSVVQGLPHGVDSSCHNSGLNPVVETVTISVPTSVSPHHDPSQRPDQRPVSSSPVPNNDPSQRPYSTSTTNDDPAQRPRSSHPPYPSSHNTTSTYPTGTGLPCLGCNNDAHGPTSTFPCLGCDDNTHTPSTSVPSIVNRTSTAASSSTTTPKPFSTCRPTTWAADKTGRAPSTGKLTAAVLFVDFPDFPATTTTDDLFANISSIPAEVYKTMSYGQLSLDLVRINSQFIRMPEPMAAYNYSGGLTTAAHLHYINAALQQVDPSISFSNVDVLYVLPPLGATEINRSSATAEDVVTPSNHIISNSITFGQDLYSTWGPKTINHETGHTLGLPDLYPYDSAAVTKWVGGFELMGLIAGQSPDFLAWHKWYLGWINDEQVTCITEPSTSTHVLSPIEVASKAGTIKALAIPLNATGFLMVEARSALGIDSAACGTGVLLYYTVTQWERSSVPGQDQAPVIVVDTHPGTIGCGTEFEGNVLNDAPLKVGESWSIDNVGTVRVTGMNGDDYVVEVKTLSR